MKIAVIADIHENFHNVILFLKQVAEYDVKKILFLGDFINNKIAEILAWSSIPVYAIRWNNDGDKVAITKTALSAWSNLQVWFETFDSIEIENRKIFLTHYPLLAKPMAKSWDFDAVFYGHNHIHNIDKVNDCLVVNPWEISAHKTGVSTFAIYDTDTNQAEIITLQGSISLKTKEADEYRETTWVSFSKTKGHQY